MISLKEVHIRNFMSYGDYWTKFDLQDLGVCFISGKIADDEDEDRSNGAGKSTLTQTILWALSGRTMHSAKPGNGVRNWFSDDDTIVKLILKDDSEITRVRSKTDQTLAYSRRGDEIINSTLSTSPNQQADLNKLLAYDHEIFTGSVFMSQFKRTWLGPDGSGRMTDAACKSTLERVMGIDRITLYANSAKEKRDKAKEEQDKLNLELGVLETALQTIQDQLDSTQNEHDKFDESRQDKHDGHIRRAESLAQQANDLEVPDIEALKRKWEMVAKVEEKIEEKRVTLAQNDTAIDKIKNQTDANINDIESKIIDFNKSHAAVIKDIDSAKETAIKEAGLAHDESCNDLRNELEPKIKAIEEKTKELEKDISRREGDRTSLDDRIKVWEGKEGLICQECEQEVPHEHVGGKTKPLQEQLSHIDGVLKDLNEQLVAANKELEELEESAERRSTMIESTFNIEKKHAEEVHGEAIRQAKQLHEQTIKQANASMTDLKDACESAVVELRAKDTDIREFIKTTTAKLEKARPDVSVASAETYVNQKALLMERANQTREQARETLSEPNPHVDALARIGDQVKEAKGKVDTMRSKVEKYDYIYNHYHYIYRAYSDRRKVKSFLISRHCPFLNARLEHYLDAFNLDLRVRVNETLAIENSHWSHKFQSGGELARSNLAFMFAVFDLHHSIHGAQSNLLVLDEPDDGLDGAGVRYLINIINNELSAKFETVLVISHEDKLKDVFPRQITIERIDRLSHIRESR